MTARNLLIELRAAGFFGHVHEPGAVCWACKVDAALDASLCPSCKKLMTLHCEPCDEESRKWDEYDAADEAAALDDKVNRTAPHE